MNIKSVAKEAGVSVATVSRVLNHPDSVAQETKEHIISVMESLNYKPSLLARGLKMSRTGTIALLIPDITDLGYMEIAKGVEDVAHQKANNIMLCSTEDDEAKELDYIENFVARKVDGIILVSTHQNKSQLDEIKSQGIPVVLIGKNEELRGENLVYTDYDTATADAIHHLMEIGHTRIGAIVGNRPVIENADKMAGFKRALAEGKLTQSTDSIIEDENSIEGGFLAASKLLGLKSRPQAVFVTSDMMAIGVMEKIKQEGLRIPEDIAVVGFDNLKISGYLEPKLTTVTKPVYRMGLVSARLLYDLMDELSEEPSEPQEILIQSKLKVRKSCGHQDRVKEIF